MNNQENEIIEKCYLSSLPSYMLTEFEKEKLKYLRSKYSK